MLSECMHICVTTECPMLCIYPFNARAFSFPTVRAVSSELTPTFFDRVSSISDTPRTFTCASTLNYTWIILCLPCSDLEHRRTLWLLPNLVPYRSNCKGGLPCEPVMSGLPKSTNCARIGAIELLWRILEPGEVGWCTVDPAISFARLLEWARYDVQWDER